MGKAEQYEAVIGEMRLTGAGYKKIAKELGLSLNTVVWICKRNGLSGKEIGIPEVDYSPIECKFCKKEFKPRWENQVYCSSSCRIAFNKPEPKTRQTKKKQVNVRKCIWCGKEYTAESKKTKCCSKECGHKYAGSNCKGKLKKDYGISYCKHCGKQLTRIQTKTKNKYCSQECSTAAITIRHEVVCEGCGKTFMPKGTDRTQYCSRECRFDYLARQAKINEPVRLAKEKAYKAAWREAQKELMRPVREAARIAKEQERERKRIEAEQERAKALVRNCDECGNEYTATRLGTKYCSKECLNRRNNRVKELKRRERLALNGPIDWGVTLERLIKRDKNICHICGGKCDKKDKYINEQGAVICGNDYPSIDHVKAVTLGGTHTWGNVKLAHRWCNTIKRNKRTYETSNGQMVLAM